MSTTTQEPAVEVEPPEQDVCKTCCGNGEVVTDWDRYLHARMNDQGDEAVEPCEDCDGTGYVDPEETK